MNKPQLFKILTVVALFLLLMQSTAYIPSQTNTPNRKITTGNILSYTQPSTDLKTSVVPEWWNSSWHYRLYLNVSFSTASSVNYSVYVVVNFTKEMEQVSVANRTIDVNSIRVVEYNATSGAVITEVPSRFIPFSYWNPTTNAVGAILFLVTAPIEANVNRTYHVYFDTTFFGPKAPPTYVGVFDGYWEQFYYVPYSSTAYTTPDSVPYGTLYLEREHNKIFYSDNTAYPGDPFPPEVGTTDDFGGNWTTWLYVNTSGNFGFRLYSDDGSWLMINDSIIIDNGGLHAPTSVSTSIYLSEGIYKLTVKWYERTGTALINLYWTYPGATEELLTSTIYGFDKAKLMDYSSLPTRTLGKVETSFLLTVTAVDKTNKPVESTDILVFNATSVPETLLFSTKTDSNGKAYLSLTKYGTYRIIVRNETLYPTWSTEKIWVENNSYTITVNETNIFSKVSTTIVLPLSTIDLLVTDLNGNPMKATPKEITEVLLYNSSLVNMTGNYIQTNTSGYVRFFRIPSDNYIVGFKYTTYYYYQSYDENIMGRATLDATTSGTRTIKIGLTDVNVHVASLDYYDVPSANVEIKKLVGTNLFVQANTTMNNGIATFYHVLNGTWNVSASYTNAFGQYVDNNSVVLTYQSDVPQYILLSLADFNIKAIDSVTQAPLPSTNITIFENTAPGLSLSLLTNASGWVNFHLILTGSYNVSANYQGNDQTNVTSLILLTSETNIAVSITVNYLDGYTYLFALSDPVSFVTWNDNITLLVNFSYYLASDQSMHPILVPDWLNFTVYLGSTVISSGTLGDGVINNNNGNYTLLINTTYLNMYPSPSYYTIVVTAKNSTALADPYPIVYTVQVSEARSTAQPDKTSFTLNWTDITSLTVRYTDTTHTLPISGALLSYSVYNASHILMIQGQVTSTTDLYTFNILTEASNLIPGEYTIEIFVGKKGYNNQTITVYLSVVNATTDIQLITAETIEVTWGENVSVSANYINVVNSITVADANAYMVLNGTYEYPLSYNVTTGSYSVTFNSSKLFSGTYTVKLYMSKDYYEGKVKEFTIKINPVPMHYVFVSGVNSSYNVTWTDVLEMRFYIQTNVTNKNITMADVTLSWSPIQHKNVGIFNDTLGVYIVLINTSEVYSGIYNLTLNAQLTNYTSITYYMSIVINDVPSDIIAPDSIDVVWGKNLALSILYIDTYHNSTGIPYASVSVAFGGQTNVMNMLNKNGTYYLSVPSDVVNPGIHNLTIIAQKQNYQLVVKVINVTVLVPVQISAEDIVGYWGTEISITVNVTNTFNGTNVENGTVIINVDDVEVQLVSTGNGSYMGTLDLGYFKTETPYTMTITFVKNMYEQARITKSLYVNPVPTKLEILSWIPGTANYSIEEGTTNNVTVIVFYNNTLTGAGITDANLYAIWGNETYNLTEIGAGEYRLYLDISNLTASPNPYTIEIHATKGNYTESVTTFTFTIHESTITIPGTNIKVPRSIVVTGVGGSVISITAFGAALYGYRLYKIPKIIRQLDKIIKLVAKGQTPDFTELPTTEQMLKDALADLFTSLPGTEIEKLIKKES